MAIRGLSQNFLIDKTIAGKIVSSADVKRDERILEIGPGRGALTELLLPLTSHLLAIEKDPLLAAALKTAHPSLDIREGDFLSFPLEEAFLGEKAKIIANIPYHITTEILKKIVLHRRLFSSAILMVQEEVAEKFCRPNLRDRSFSQALIRSYAAIHFLFSVPRECFSPQPKVHSAVIRLDLKPIPENSYPEFLRNLFQQKKRQLFPLLSALYPKEIVHRALETLNISPEARPCSLPEETLLSLYFFLEEKSP